jgi:hypothetical protein
MNDINLQPSADTTISQETTVASNEPVVGNSESAPVDFRSLISPEFKDAKVLQNFKDVNELVKSHIHLNSLLGKKVNEYAKEDLEGFMGKLGKPEAPEKYVAPEELGKEELARLQKHAHKANLTQEQFKSLVDEMILEKREMTKQEQELYNVAESKWADEIRKEFGFALNERLALADRAVKHIGGDELMQLLQDTGLNKHPSVVRAFSKIGKDFLEGDKVVSADVDAKFGITPAEAENRIRTLQSDKEFTSAYLDSRHPGHAKAVEEMTVLFKSAYGSRG